MTTLLVTGGVGFIGSNYIRHVLGKGRVDRLINLDLLTYAGNLENLEGIEADTRYRFLRGDVADAEQVRKLVDEPIDEIVHFAAESHVDRSIEDASAFLRTNVQGTQVMIDLAREWQVDRMVHVSTDEVYGDLGPTDPAFSETTAISPNSPYAASKAASDLLVLAAVHTHGLPAVVTRCSNNYGAYQFPEKLIPLMIANAMEDRVLPVYGDGSNVRDWIHVEDHCRGVELVREKGKLGEVYNIGGRSEMRNLEVVEMILSILGKPKSLIQFVTDRPGHDRRYAIDDTRIGEELGFRPEMSFAEGIEKTVRWYQDQRSWWERVRSGAYTEYYDRMYGSRLGES